MLEQVPTNQVSSFFPSPSLSISFVFVVSHARIQHIAPSTASMYLLRSRGRALTHMRPNCIAYTFALQQQQQQQHKKENATTDYGLQWNRGGKRPANCNRFQRYLI